MSESLTLFAESAWLTEVLVTLATTPRYQQLERVAPLLFQVVLDHFDPTRQGMVVKLIQLVHPPAGKPVRSVRLTHMIGTTALEQDMHPAQLYLAGSESLVGRVITSGCAALVEDVRQQEKPRPANRWVKSTMVVPLLYGTQIAGALAICSPTTRSFSPPHIEFLQQYATILALTFLPEAFYASEQISLVSMPSPDVQRPLAPRFHALLMRQLTASNSSQNSQAHIEAEQLAWQKIEEELLALTIPQEEPFQPGRDLHAPVHTAEVLAFQQSQQTPLDQLKDRLAVTIIHELRTPLTVVGGYLDLLQEYAREIDLEQIIAFLSYAQKGYHELQSLVNTMTEAVAISEKCSLKEREHLYIREIIQGVIEKFDASQMQAYRIDINISDTLQVWADRQALEQVVHHLLSNVFKYVPQQTTLTIAARHLEETSSVCISLQDIGPGIPPEEIPLLFEKFARLRRDVASSTSGMGLGLFISKRLIEAMRGQIWVESSGQAGAGSCFCFTLPTQAEQENPRLIVQQQ